MSYGERDTVISEPSYPLSIPTKLFLGFSVVFILFAVVLVYNSSRLGSLYEEVTVINRGLVPLRLTLSEIESDLRSYSVLLAERDPVVLRRAILASQTLFPFPRRVEDGLVACMEAVEELEAQDLSIRQEVLFQGLRSTIEELQARNRILTARSDAIWRALEDETSDQIEGLRSGLTDVLVQMEARIASLSRQTGVIVSDALVWAAREQRRNVLAVAVSTAGAILIALLVMLWSARTLRPLTQLTEGVVKLRGGAYETVEVRAHNEIGTLAHEFNEMVRALEERDRRLREGRKALEAAHQATIEAERLAAIGQMTSQITHEIRNPLSSIALNIELLEEALRSEGPVSEEVVSTIATIVREIDQLTGITDEYLQFARLPTPRKHWEDVNEIVRQLIDFHGGEISQAGVRLELTLDPDLPQVRVDEGQLRQAILNLLRNGKEAMPHGGTLRVKTRLNDGHLEIAVADEGPGIDAETRDRIFDPFFTTKAQGTGLGLPLTRQIIAQHGGDIRCAHGEPSGTMFTIRLPYQAGEETDWTNGASGTSGTTGNQE